jgi:hypothetical protein
MGLCSHAVVMSTEVKHRYAVSGKIEESTVCLEEKRPLLLQVRHQWTPQFAFSLPMCCQAALGYFSLA